MKAQIRVRGGARSKKSCTDRTAAAHPNGATAKAKRVAKNPAFYKIIKVAGKPRLKSVVHKPAQAPALLKCPFMDRAGLCDDNFGAKTVLERICDDSVRLMMKYGYKGSQIWVLYQYVAKQDITRTAILLKSIELGLLKRARLNKVMSEGSQLLRRDNKLNFTDEEFARLAAGVREACGIYNGMRYQA